MNRISSATALWLMLGILPAAADSRELVQERMARCAGLTDTRQYLDCLYGAVQPLRSELGLPQAPQATSFAPLFAQPAPQRVAPSVQPAIAQQPQKPGLLASMFSDITGIKPIAVPPEQFGLRTAKPGPGRNVDHITARMTAYSRDRKTGAFSVTLENGQVWQRGGSEELLPPWTGPASSYVATVSYGAGSTFNLSVEGERRPYKVQRTR